LHPTSIHTLSLHDALPISPEAIVTFGAKPCNLSTVKLPWQKDSKSDGSSVFENKNSQTNEVDASSLESSESEGNLPKGYTPPKGDRKSTRLNSSHVSISYA